MVCKSCGSEVSPYVTECPYCGHRLRKRAPRLEREGDEIKVLESRRERRKRERRERRERKGDERGLRLALGETALDARPVATIGVLAVCGLLLIAQRAVPLSLSEAGAIVGPVGGELWRYVTAPFAYDDLGTLIVLCGTIAIFGPGVERRIGTVSALMLMLICGTGGMLAADATVAAGLRDSLIAAGGNGVALGLIGAWVVLRRAEADFGEPVDFLGVVTVAVVVLVVPLVEASADPIGGLVGGLLGLALGGISAARLGRRGG